MVSLWNFLYSPYAAQFLDLEELENMLHDDITTPNVNAITNNNASFFILLKLLFHFAK